MSIFKDKILMITGGTGSFGNAVAMNQNGDYGIPVPDYLEEYVSTKVVKIIQSYVSIVNIMEWRKV